MQNKSNKIISAAFCFFFLIPGISFSQTGNAIQETTGKHTGKYWIFFTDKNGVSFDPYEYFDAKTIENRLSQNIPLSDSTDFPLNEKYVATVKAVVDSVSYHTRWFNGIAVFATSNQVDHIRTLSFVRDIEPMTVRFEIASTVQGEEVGATAIYDTSLSATRRLLLNNQTMRMGREEFEKMNIDGKGRRIAVFDAGFPTVDVNPSFEHLRKENRILKTWDFVKNKEFVYGFNAHGTMVLSCIAGKTGDQKSGLATGAEFILARTEMAQREPYAEEEYWLAAAEWADRNGANIISSSLAYTYHRYFRKDMDGKRSLVSKAANMAASKGMLVVNAAGNDGKSEWKIIATPSDADSVLSVGGISPYSDYHINFSSFGPTADKRMKPNVCAFGQVVVAGKKGLEESFGTSFATPLVAGFAACAWQMNPGLNNMEIFREIEKSGDLYPYFDYAHGFGVPQASFFTGNEKSPHIPTFDFAEDNYYLKVVIRDEFYFSGKDTAVDLQQTLEEAVSDMHTYLYYHIENSSGYLDKYYIVRVDNKEVLELSKENFSKGKKVRVFYKGYTGTFEFR